MLVTFISECQKNSLKRTRRILDTFANRIGNNTWQTPITQEGLNAVKKLLRKTASKNTAVSCHQLKSHIRTELLWIVGNRSKFNNEGIVAVNYTEQDISQFMDKNNWKTINSIKNATAIAGLFHDFGKANNLFQNKLNPKITNKKTFEPYRHEWVSLRLFQAFVGDDNDKQWLDRLIEIDKTSNYECFKDGVDGNINKNNNPLTNLPPFAKLVAWLVVSHHKLLLYPNWKGEFNSPKKLEEVDNWIDNFNSEWNSPNRKNQDLQGLIKDNWQFNALPYQSAQWRSYASAMASEAKHQLPNNIDFLHDELFSTHFARLCLILADHYYSSLPLDKVTPKWRNSNYQVWANTDKDTKQYKQQLDEHLIGVACNAQEIAQALPKFNTSLQSLKPSSEITDNVDEKFKTIFGWQDDAKKLAKKLGKSSAEQGFFGINMASTGKGKTLANAKIMVALGSEINRIRFSVALGLRTLTLQTGKEYREKLNIKNDQLGVMIGSIAVRELFENEQNKQNKVDDNPTGSTSENDSFNDLNMDYQGMPYTHSLHKWTKNKDNLEKLIQTPVLVSTIDHLIPATEGARGDKHIAPMLRLLSADLVLDEPDDFGLDDLPALCRLVNWAGMLGSKVLLSTATMPPALVNGLFVAYQSGWAQYAKTNLDNWNGEIICAWFDEYKSDDGQFKKTADFKKHHAKFVNNRIKELEQLKPQRKAEIKTIAENNGKLIIENMAIAIQDSIIKLHNRHIGQHKQSLNNKNISIGLVRMANIKQLVATAKELLKLKLNAAANTCIHYCIYHSKFPLGIRSHIENKLDRILNRKYIDGIDPIWQQIEIESKLENSDKTNHIFVVLASPVAEVGRDHDYDWAVVEPSSMRSIIQLAGRVFRHRTLYPSEANIILLNKNYKALNNENLCFIRPGFESKYIKMNEDKYDLNDILNKNQYQKIDAIPRIEEPENYDTPQHEKLVKLEHKALKNKLFSKNDGAKLWWKKNPTWCGELQRQQQFRQSKKDEAYYLFYKDEYADKKWFKKNEDVYPAKLSDTDNGIITDEKFDDNGIGSSFWFDLDALKIYQQLDIKNRGLKYISERFGEVRLIEYKNTQQEYKYHPNLGVYEILE